VENLIIEATIKREKATWKKKVGSSRKRKDLCLASPTLVPTIEVVAAISEGKTMKRKIKENAHPSKELVFTLDEAFSRGKRLF